MKFGPGTSGNGKANTHRKSARKVQPESVAGGIAAASIAVACACFAFGLTPGAAPAITASLPTTQPDLNTQNSASAAQVAVTTVAKTAAPMPPQANFDDRFAPIAKVAVAKSLPAQDPAVPETDEARAIRSIAMALLDPGYQLGAPPATFMANEPPRSVVARPQPAEAAPTRAVPLPSPRMMAALGPVPSPRDVMAPDPAGKPESRAARPRSPGHEVMVQRARATVAAASKQPGIFDKLFGRTTPATPAIAYAALDAGVRSDGSDSRDNSSRAAADESSPYDRFTAVYDISARTVYMPDGSKLEAHSGLGPKMDDPNYVHVRMHGPTPPHIYDLKPREKLFHGVAALRMTPVGGEGAIHGRTGLLTHSYLLGPRGDSNGCISFRNYDAFLKAYRNDEVKRIVVVASLN